jgi:ABC-type Fe3+/spermidine/putrescine transport system ATPase subunit
MSAVALDHVAKRFGAVSVVRDVSLDVADGELVALLGPSGSGKTTLLRLIAGFELPDAGRIRLAGRDVTGLDALQRRCGMVFQHYALFPHLSVAENVGYGLAADRLSRAERVGRVREALALVDLDGLQDRPVTALSGGQQQRVALARALAPRPAVLLLDEPLSNLDPSLRERTRQELRQLVDQIGITTILVTHEQEEAFELADRVALLMGGDLVQVGAPEALYLQPASAAVTGFVGRAMAVPGLVTGRDARGLRVTALGAEFSATGDQSLQGAVTLMLRPEALALTPGGPINASVQRRRFTGAIDFLVVDIDDQQVEVAAPPGRSAVGDTVHLSPTATGAHAFAPDVDTP